MNNKKQKVIPYKLGPYNEWEEFQVFSRLSNDVYSYFNEIFSAKSKELKRPMHHMFYRFKYLAESSSHSFRLISSWTFGLPALALLRVRLEQLIVCSYLIYEDVSQGLSNYLKHTAINKYYQIKTSFQDGIIKDRLETKFDLLKMANGARLAQIEIDPEYNMASDKFQRKWTKLNLRSMAIRRDSLAATKFRAHSLEREYLTFYNVLSSLTHSDCSTISHEYLGEYAAEGKIVLMTKPEWIIIGLACMAHYDILQCHEILNFFNIDVEEHFGILMGQWQKERDRCLIR